MCSSDLEKGGGVDAFPEPERKDWSLRLMSSMEMGWGGACPVGRGGLIGARCGGDDRRRSRMSRKSEDAGFWAAPPWFGGGGGGKRGESSGSSEGGGGGEEGGGKGGLEEEQKGRGRWRWGCLLGLIRRSAMAAAAAAGGGVHGFPLLLVGRRGIGFWGREMGGG